MYGWFIQRRSHILSEGSNDFTWVPFNNFGRNFTSWRGSRDYPPLRSTLMNHQRLVRVQILTKSMTGEEVAREHLSVLSTEYSVACSNLLAAMHDRASVNTIAVRTLKVLSPNLLDISSHHWPRRGQFWYPYLAWVWHTLGEPLLS